MKSPKLFVFASPSGGGKTSIIKEIRRRHPEIEFSVSATTREMRNGEVHGKDYFFIPQAEFERLVKNNELVEYEFFFNTYYGTLKREVDRALNSGHSMIFDIDVKGAKSIQAKYPNESKLIFIAPPSMEILEQRLRNRNTETEEKLQRRLQRAAMEMDAGKSFDYTIINDDLIRAIDETDEIVKKYFS